MKWFKHMSHANSDDKLVSIRAKYGMWGVGSYWTLVELVAAQMKPKTNSPTASLRLSELQGMFGCKRTKLISFLKHLRNIRGMFWKSSGDVLEIEIPKLLEIKDNYSKDLEVSSKQEVDVDVEVDKSLQRESKSDRQERESAALANQYLIPKLQTLSRK